MLKTLKDPEGPWRLKWAATAIFYMQWWQKCVWLSVLNVWFFFRIQKWLEMMGLPPKEHRRWPCLRFELRLCRAPWDWLPHWNKTRCSPMISNGFDASVWCLGLIRESGCDTCFEQDEAQSNADLPVIRSSSHGVRQHLLRQVQFSWSGANPWLLIPGQWYPAAFTNHFIKKIGAIECITKSVFSIKCKTKVLYEMTPFYPWNDPLFHYIVYVEPLFSNHSSSIFESSMNLEARH